MSVEAPPLAAAEASLKSGRPGAAIGALRTFLGENPHVGEAHLMLATALEMSGDRAGAEIELRETLALVPQSLAAAVRLATILMGRRQTDEAVAILETLAPVAGADLGFHTALGTALKSAGRMDEAVGAYAAAIEAAPASGEAEHNLAGALADAHRFAESEASARRAFAKGLDGPETWLVHARALQGQRQFPAAEDAFREVIRRRPAYADAHADLAQLVWMRTEDSALALEALDKALRELPGEPHLSLVKAKVLEYAGDLAGGYAILATALAARPADPMLNIGASRFVLASEPQLALTHAEKAFAVAPGLGPAATALCVANLAVGRAELAARIAEDLCRDWPIDQYPVALAGTAWRLLGDPRYRELYDYDRLVRGRIIETPAGWPTLEAYLADLSSTLRELQSLRGHPVGQSLRSGSQTGQSLARSDNPVVKAFFAAIDPLIRDYMGVLKERDDVLGRRVTGSYRFAGAWSALLRPGGHHVDHLHPMGWISSACHISLPTAIDSGRQGWLKFGEPGVPTLPALPPEHFVKPEPGRLVLFPSYMWHGTVPFEGEESRLTVAFDVLPT